SLPATVLWVQSERGRARQLNAGARVASRPYLWFLHADTQLPGPELSSAQIIRYSQRMFRPIVALAGLSLAVLSLPGHAAPKTCGSPTLEKRHLKADMAFAHACTRAAFEASAPEPWRPPPARAELLAHAVSTLNYAQAERPAAEGPPPVPAAGPLSSLSFLQRRFEAEYNDEVEPRLNELSEHLQGLTRATEETRPAALKGAARPAALREIEAVVARISELDFQLRAAIRRGGAFRRQRCDSLYSNCAATMAVNPVSGVFELKAGRSESELHPRASADAAARLTTLRDRHRELLMTASRHQVVGDRILSKLETGLCAPAERGTRGCFRGKTHSGSFAALQRIFVKGGCPEDPASLDDTTARLICQARSALDAMHRNSYDSLRLAAKCRNLLYQLDQGAAALSAHGCVYEANPRLESLISPPPPEVRDTACDLLAAAGLSCPES
ncbi:MAG: hypothetical protein IT285_06585, partial [Bdellovibrionales bacterium]|nr:hypothetical protein [Bdellovibrionales bacterium]